MLSRLFSGADADHGRGHAVTRRRRPQPGDLRLARRVGVQHPRLRPRLPGGRRVDRVATYPLTVNRRSDARILEVANALAAPLYDAVRRRCAPLEPKPGAATATVAGRGARDLRRRAGLARRQVQRRAPAMAEPRWSRDRRAHPRQRARRRRLRRADRRRDPGRDRRPQGPAAAARGRRGRRHADAAARPDRQRRAADPADRPALGDRRRATSPCSAGARPSWPGARAAARAARASDDELAARRRGRRPDRGRVASATRWTTRATRRLLAPRRASGSRCWPGSCATCARTPASRCSTWSGGSSTPPASTSSWPRRSARRRRPGATTSTCSSRRSRSSRPSTAT